MAESLYTFFSVPASPTRPPAPSPPPPRRVSKHGIMCPMRCSHTTTRHAPAPIHEHPQTLCPPFVGRQWLAMVIMGSSTTCAAWGLHGGYMGAAWGLIRVCTLLLPGYVYVCPGGGSSFLWSDQLDSWGYKGGDFKNWMIAIDPRPRTRPVDHPSPKRVVHHWRMRIAAGVGTGP